jgi:molecular chaperone DnaK
MCGLVSPDPPLPYNIGIAKYFDDKEKDLFYPVKGLERNKQIPATGVATGLKTRCIIEAGNDKTWLRIPIYQGEHNAAGTDLGLQIWIYDVIISGRSLPRTLPQGSLFDISIKIDKSQRMVFRADFPSIDYSEELEIDIKQEKVKSVTSLNREISETKKIADKKKRPDLIEKLDDLSKKLADGAGSDDIILNVQNDLRIIQRELISDSQGESWENIAKKLNEDFDALEEQINQIGEANLEESDKAAYDDVIRKKALVLSQKDIKAAKNLIEDINVLKIRCDPQKFVKIIIAFHSQFHLIKWKNEGKARELIDNGLVLIKMNAVEGLIIIIKELFALIVRTNEDPTGGFTPR